MKGYCSKHTQDPSSSPRTRCSNGQNDPTTLFLWTGVRTSEWLSSEIQSLKLSQGNLTSHIASETSIASGNNEKQIRNKIRTWKPLFSMKRASTVQILVYKRVRFGILCWKQTPDFSAVLIPSLTLYPSWLMKLKGLMWLLIWDLVLFTSPRWKLVCTYGCWYWWGSLSSDNCFYTQHKVVMA